MTIDELVDLQADRRLGDVHVVELREDGFAIAHTDQERTNRVAYGVPLESCSLHVWLSKEGPPDVPPGLYTATVHQPDGYSESYRSDPWEFEPLER